MDRGSEQTIDGSGDRQPDLPAVPKLEPQDWTRLIVVPASFREEVEKAAHDRRLGDLELLSLEARTFDWASEGLRLVGRAQFQLKAWEGARDTWEAVREQLDGDREADLKLGTVHQRLGDLAASDIAAKCALADLDITDWQRAEAYSLLGSNERTRWTKAWKDPPGEDKCEQALGSRYLRQAQEYYSEGFASDLNHFYSPVLNALALQTIVTELAKAYPETWAIDFENEEEAEAALKKVDGARRQLEGGVALSVERERRRLERRGETDRWADITQADVALLAVKNPQRVVRLYRKALEGAEDFYLEFCAPSACVVPGPWRSDRQCHRRHRRPRPARAAGGHHPRQAAAGG